MIKHLRDGKFRYLSSIPFKCFTVTLSDDSRIQVTQKRDEKKSRHSTRTPRVVVTLDYRVSSATGVPTLLVRSRRRPSEDVATKKEFHGTITYDSESEILREQRLIDHPYLRQSGPETYFDERTGDEWTEDELADILPEASLEKKHATLLNFCEGLPAVKFIRADRLSTTPRVDRAHHRYGRLVSPRTQLMVERLGQDVRAHVQDADKQYRLVSTQLDTELRSRLIEPTIGMTPTNLDDLREGYKELEKEEARLQSLGLMNELSPPVSDEAFSEKNGAILSILLSDNERKLTPFKRLADRAESLLRMLNKKLAPKTVRLDVETGYHVTTENGHSLPLSKLSSGEQHEFVLLHELLFEAVPGSLILIDEPELSLHVTWQSEFLPDVLSIAGISDLDFMLATHSPYIIGEEHKLMIRLGRPVDECA